MLHTMLYGKRGMQCTIPDFTIPSLSCWSPNGITYGSQVKQYMRKKGIWLVINLVIYFVCIEYSIVSRRFTIHNTITIHCSVVHSVCVTFANTDKHTENVQK